MSEAAIDAPTPVDPEPDAPPTAWEVLLGRTAGAAGAEPEAELLSAVARATRPEDEASWPDRLVEALGQLGLHATAARGSVAEAVEAVGLEHPVVALGPSAEFQILVDRRGRRSVAVETPFGGAARWTRRGELAALLDPEGQGAVSWVMVSARGLTVPPRLGASAPGESHDPLVRLRALLRAERHDVLVVLVYAIGVGILTLTTPVAVQALVNTVAFGTLLQPLVVLAFLLFLGLAFAAVLRALSAYVVEVLQRRLFVRFVSEFSYRIPRTELATFDTIYGPERANRFFDVLTVQKAAATLLLGGLDVVLTAVVGMTVLAFYHPALLVFDLILVVLVLAILFGLGRGAVKTAVYESKRKYEVAAWLEELARQPALFRQGGGLDLARREADRLASGYLRARRSHFRVVFGQLLGLLVLQAVASAGVLGIGGWLVIERELTLGQLVAAELIVTAVVASLAKLAKHLETSYDLLAGLDKLGLLLDLPLEEVPHTATCLPVSPVGSALEADQIRFDREVGGAILSELSLTLAPGERVGLFARTGEGASTLVDVLAGLRPPSGGRVRLDGVDLRDLRREALRARVAVVKGPEIVSGSLVDNVAFGRPGVDARAVREALAAVDLLDELAMLPEGLATRLHPSGAPLSSGQAVRLALARALAGEPTLLLIDRALDGLDEEMQSRLLDTALAPGAKRTVLVVSRDEAVFARCARRLVLLDGRVEEVRA